MNNYKKEILVVDFLNIGLLPILRKLDSKNNVLLIYLFSSNYFIEKFIKFFLKLKNIENEFIPFNSKKIYKIQTNISDEITSKFIKECNLKRHTASSYLDVIIGKIFYEKIYKIVAPNIFIKSLNLKNVKVYFNNSKVQKHIETSYDFKNLNYYNAFGRLNSQSYLFDYNNQSHSLFKTIFIILKSACHLLFSFKNSLPKVLKYKPLFCVHTVDNSFFRIVSRKFEKANYSYLVFSEPFKIKYKKKKYDIRCLNFVDIIYVFKQYIKLLADLKPSNFLTIYDKVSLMREYFNIFYVNNFIKKMKPPLFYSRYETTMCQLFQVLAKNYNCITLASVFSYGYFPQKYEGGHQIKFCDIFFVWGKKHSDLILHSGDQSNFHIISGYGQGVRLVKTKYLKYKNLVCFCDNTFYDDLYLNKKEVFRILTILIDFAYKYNYKIIIKTKRYKHIYKDLMKSNSSVIIEIDNNLGSIEQYHKDTIFLGYSLFTLGMLALKQNNLALFFDKYDMIWNKISLDLKYYIVKNENDLLIKIKNHSKLRLNKSKSLISQLIDLDDVDGNDKITDYILFYMRNFNSSQNFNIDKVNKLYSEKWGKKNLVFNKNNTDFKFKSFL